MGNCMFCGEPAGTFRSKHSECQEKHDLAVEKMPAFFVQSLTSPLAVDRFRDLASEIARTNHIDPDKFRALVVQGLSSAIDAALDDHLLSESEEERLITLRDAFGLQMEALGAAGHRLAKAGVLRELEQGKLPQRLQVDGPVPLNLGRGEQIIWLFNKVTHYTMRTRTEYVGRSQGASFRIMKGVYYRVGASRGEPVRTQHLSREGEGDLIVTNRNVFFLSDARTLKIPAKKIITIKPYSDGIELMRDAANARPQIFQLDDPWFAVNLISRLDQIES